MKKNLYRESENPLIECHWHIRIQHSLVFRWKNNGFYIVSIDSRYKKKSTQKTVNALHVHYFMVNKLDAVAMHRCNGSFVSSALSSGLINFCHWLHLSLFILFYFFLLSFFHYFDLFTQLFLRHWCQVQWPYSLASKMRTKRKTRFFFSKDNFFDLKNTKTFRFVFASIISSFSSFLFRFCKTFYDSWLLT